MAEPRYELIPGSGKVRVTTAADLKRVREEREAERATGIYPLGFEEWLWMAYGGHQYPLGISTSFPQSNLEEPTNEFATLAGRVYKRNGVVFACMLLRMLAFSEARFQYRKLQNGRPGAWRGDTSLAPLERPWPGGTTRDMAARAIQDVDLAGNSYYVMRPARRIKRLRPDWVTVVVGVPDEVDGGSAWQADAEVLGYIYKPGGEASGVTEETYLREEVAHWAPIPDPDASYRGMTWLSTVMKDIMGDTAMSDHKIQFLDNAATPNLLVKVDPTVRRPDDFSAWVDKFKASHEGRANAYKTLFLGAGSDASVIGTNFEQLAFKDVQGAGETRIAAAARTPPTLVGLSEGLQGSSLNQGNYAMARRQFSDLCIRPLWNSWAGAMAVIVPPPGGEVLAVDDRDIPFLREDEQDRAKIQQMQAAAIRTLLDAGFDAATAVKAITSGDLEVLKHSGLFSVQLQPPMPEGPPVAEGANGNQPAPAAAS